MHCGETGSQQGPRINCIVLAHGHSFAVDAFVNIRVGKQLALKPFFCGPMLYVLEFVCMLRDVERRGASTLPQLCRSVVLVPDRRMLAIGSEML